MKTPAPGTYNAADKTGNEGPKFHIGAKLENQSAIATEQKKVKVNPGPGAYQPQYENTVKKEASYTLKSRHGRKELQDAPGPGAYQPGIGSAKKEAPSYRFGN